MAILMQAPDKTYYLFDGGEGWESDVIPLRANGQNVKLVSVSGKVLQPEPVNCESVSAFIHFLLSLGYKQFHPGDPIKIGNMDITPFGGFLVGAVRLPDLSSRLNARIAKGLMTPSGQREWFPDMVSAGYEPVRANYDPRNDKLLHIWFQKKA